MDHNPPDPCIVTALIPMGVTDGKGWRVKPVNIKYTINPIWFTHTDLESLVDGGGRRGKRLPTSRANTYTIYEYLQIYMKWNNRRFLWPLDQHITGLSTAWTHHNAYNIQNFIHLHKVE